MVTTRAVLIGALVATAWAAISTYSDHYARLTWGFGWGSLPAGPVALAFLVVLANGVLKRLWPRRALGLSEVLIVYSILTLAAALIVANTPYMLPIAAYPHYHARVAVWWDTTILNYLPSWLHPRNPEQMAWFWEGVPAGTPIPWGDWLAPVAGWGSFAAALMVAMLCLGTLLRKDWIERQRLTFPLTEIPMAMVGDEAQPTLGRSAFGQRMFWVGFGLSGALIVLVWLNRLYPSVPAPDLFQQLGQSFAGAGLPWSALSFLVVRIAPATIGVMCLVPGEISFSLWAFFVLYCLYLVVCGSFGLPPEGSQAMGSFHPRAFAEYACSGGFVVVAAMALYQSRDAFAVGLRALLKRQREADDPVAPMTNGAALLGFVAANGFMLWWALAAGMSWWSFALIMMACYVSMIGTSRLVAAVGLLQARPAVNTRWTVLRMVGADAIGPRSLVMYNYLTMGFWLEPQNFGIVYLMNALKLIHVGRIRARGFAWAVIVPTVTVLLAGAAGLLYTSYRYGAVTMECWPITAVPTCTFREFGASLQSPEQASNWLRFAMVAGGAFTLLLYLLSSRFLWWPFAPIGFIVASVYHTNHHVWTNAMIAWLLTTIIRRYGGLKLYRELRPAFLGLVLGQLLTEVAMVVISAGLLGARGLRSVDF
jgi:type IV secretory pathway VirB3-like protein